MKIVSLILHAFKVFIFFTGCTILFYYGIMWVNEEYQNYHRYDEPQGAAVKVSGRNSDSEPGMIDRLILFYLNGE
ncbi:Protein of unknown function [Mesobacillus persicus]|uniref:DUF4227 family protein n=1 Tax=Mesobacillus persicus TaxID=930146 RepID=A0A1H8BWQ7_9BACI|nr:YqzK family protein [Mesobacillus persicus]SEM87182.1 Protein of unknown function [Mesobacillus persicus]